MISLKDSRSFNYFQIAKVLLKRMQDIKLNEKSNQIIWERKKKEMVNKLAALNEEKNKSKEENETFFEEERKMTLQCDLKGLEEEKIQSTMKALRKEREAHQEQLKQMRMLRNKILEETAESEQLRSLTAEMKNYSDLQFI